MQFMLQGRALAGRPPCRGVDRNINAMLAAANAVVAPRAGAWIGNGRLGTAFAAGGGRPRAGAWIETVPFWKIDIAAKVARRAGAWIETIPPASHQHWLARRPPVRGRGSKLEIGLKLRYRIASPPVRGRGSKPEWRGSTPNAAPARGATRGVDRNLIFRHASEKSASAASLFVRGTVAVAASSPRAHPGQQSNPGGKDSRKSAARLCRTGRWSAPRLRR